MSIVGQSGCGWGCSIKGWLRQQMEVIVSLWGAQLLTLIILFVSLGIFLFINVGFIQPEFYMSFGEWSYLKHIFKDSLLKKHALQALGSAILAWVFTIIYLFIIWIVGFLYRAAWEILNGFPKFMILIGVVIYGLFLASALFPISMIVYDLRDLGLSRRQAYFFSLLFINGLMLYLGINFMASLKAEYTRDYILSAPFKSQTRLNYSREALLRFLLTQMSAVYYFIITFTIFPEIAAGGHTFYHDVFGQSIVYELFVTYFEVPDIFSSANFWSQLSAFIFATLLIRVLLIDFWVNLWEHFHGIELKG